MALTNRKPKYEKRYGVSGGPERQHIVNGIIEYDGDSGSGEEDIRKKPNNEATVEKDYNDNKKQVEMKGLPLIGSHDQTLQCPNCWKTFLVEEGKLLEHVKDCV